MSIYSKKLILGTVQMGLPYGINNLGGQIESTECTEILNLAKKSGIELLDTAEMYGSAHQIIGHYHKSHPQRKFKIITKLPHTINGKITQKVDQFISDLEVESLEALLFHSFQSYIENKDQLNSLEEYKIQGIIRKTGVSVYTNKEIEAVIKDERIDIIQFPYNLFDNYNLRGEVLKKAKEHGKIIHTRSCFLQGLFFSSLNSTKPIVKALKNELLELQKIEKNYNIDINKLALNYCIQEPLIDGVLIGVDSAKQLENNLNALEANLSLDIFQKINKIQINNYNLLNPSLWDQI